MDNRLLLGRTPVGRRLIALITLFNNQDEERLRQFVAEGYSAALLDESPVNTRLNQLADLFAEAGKLRVQQVLASDEHRVIVLAQAQTTGDFYTCEMAVESDYPHKITALVYQNTSHEDAKDTTG